MLTQIQIRDFATIAELYLNLNGGSTMITGETGAGKSIFIEAIEIGLGGRCPQNSVRAGKEKAEINLCFDVAQFPKVIELLKSLDMYPDQPECIIRRVITTDGRSRSYINGTPATLQLAKDLGELLFHLHSQHEQQVLLRAEKQREMLDRFADHAELTQAVKGHAQKWKAIQDEIITLKEQLSKGDNKREYLAYQLEELENLQLKPGEWENLEASHHKLTHVDELLRNLQHALHLLDNENGAGTLSILHEVRKNFEAMSQVEPKAKQWISNLEVALIQIKDLVSECQIYSEHTEVDPEELRLIEDRISQIYNLSRKHKTTPQTLAELQTSLQSEIDNIDARDINIAKLAEAATQIANEYQQVASKLTQSRHKAALKFEKEITQTMRSLSLPHGEFKISFEPTDDKTLSPYGLEKVVFLIKTNPDQPLLPLGKVISGGELSRLSLAAHLALAHRTNIPTLVFDEIDTGLSGATAEKIGKLIRKLGDSYQVFCVTHQAQVAAYSHHHLLVEKHFRDKQTHTHLRLLDNEERTKEIARMMGGEKITQKTLEHAREVLQGL